MRASNAVLKFLDVMVLCILHFCNMLNKEMVKNDSRTEDSRSKVTQKEIKEISQGNILLFSTCSEYCIHDICDLEVIKTMSRIKKQTLNFHLKHKSR